jgi:hypothetical protein
MPQTKHSPIIALVNARRELDAARDACPHWDYESEDEHAECCYRVADARRAVRKASKAAQT